MSGSSLYGPFGSGNSEIGYASLRSDVQTDLNNSPITWRPINFNAGTLLSNITDVSANIAGFVNVPVGVYYIFSSVRLTSTVVRSNVQFSLTINGTQQIIIGASGYIRGISGHNTSSVHVGEIIDITSVSTIGAAAQREAAAGTVTGAFGTIGILKLT